MTRVLVDEDLPVRLRHYFGQGIRAETVEYRGWKGLENGELLDAITAAGDLDVLITADHRMPSQQDLSTRPFAVAVLRPTRKRLPEHLELMPELLRILPSLAPDRARRFIRPAHSVAEVRIRKWSDRRGKGEPGRCKEGSRRHAASGRRTRPACRTARAQGSGSPPGPCAFEALRRASDCGRDTAGWARGWRLLLA